MGITEPSLLVPAKTRELLQTEETGSREEKSDIFARSFAPFGEARAFLIPERIRRRCILVERKFSDEATGLLIQSLAHAGGPYMGTPRDQTLMDGELQYDRFCLELGTYLVTRARLFVPLPRCEIVGAGCMTTLAGMKVVMVVFIYQLALL